MSEVLTKNKDRISLNGWFHLPRKSLKETECHVLEFEKNYGTEDSYNLKDYFSQIYFEQENNSNIKALFTASSEIQLDSFLVQEFLNELKNDLKSDKLNWISRGPPNVRLVIQKKNICNFHLYYEHLVMFTLKTNLFVAGNMKQQIHQIYHHLSEPLEKYLNQNAG